jgi:hypothetical protein
MSEPSAQASRSLTPLKDSLDAVERRVTIYKGGLVWDRQQATWVRVYRAPYAQYGDAFHVEFKPRKKRLLRSYVEGYRPMTIIVAGWEHPHVRLSILLAPGESTLAPSSNSLTALADTGNPMDEIVDAYVRSLPLGNILLDLRGLSVSRRWQGPPPTAAP